MMKKIKIDDRELTKMDKLIADDRKRLEEEWKKAHESKEKKAKKPRK